MKFRKFREHKLAVTNGASLILSISSAAQANVCWNFLSSLALVSMSDMNAFARILVFNIIADVIDFIVGHPFFASFPIDLAFVHRSSAAVVLRQVNFFFHFGPICPAILNSQLHQPINLASTFKTIYLRSYSLGLKFRLWTTKSTSIVVPSM